MMDFDDMLWRRAAVCASGIIYWVGVLVQARRIRRRIGHSPNLRPRGARERVLWLGWLLVIAVWIGQPLLLGASVKSPALAPIAGLLGRAGLVGGLLLLGLGYAGTLWTYSAMGDTWRIGVNPGERTRLISRGPYARVRHPLYAFQIVMLAGAALLLPTPLSFLVLAGHYVCVRIKAGDEERHLGGVHGPAYAEYCRRSGRLFPHWGRADQPRQRPGVDS